MTVPDRPALADVIEPGALLLVDSSATLAYLAGSERASGAAEQVFDAFVATGRNAAVMSMVTVAEVLVRPFRTGPAAIATIEGFLRHFADITLVDVTYEVAREAARIRAASGLRMPDALIVATAQSVGADVLVTNDGAWRSAIAGATPGLRVCHLEEVAAVDPPPPR
jgi:predicted nucleic acid-binding protein